MGNLNTANRGNVIFFVQPQIVHVVLGTYIRGLHEAWSRMDKSSASSKLIEAYIAVQVGMHF